uniref:Uncharacterized protein n=2 Tax=viral metagenome TaxID=1070528 RepID=A0A6M3KTF2_9ZZZZ
MSLRYNLPGYRKIESGDAMSDLTEDEIIDLVHDITKTICEKKGYVISPSKADVKLVLTAMGLIKQAITNLEKIA